MNRKYKYFTLRLNVEETIVELGIKGKVLSFEYLRSPNRIKFISIYKGNKYSYIKSCNELFNDMMEIHNITKYILDDLQVIYVSSNILETLIYKLLPIPDKFKYIHFGGLVFTGRELIITN